MFPRISKVKRANGKIDEYIQIVESKRDNLGRSRHHVVCNLGRKDLIATQLSSLIRILDTDGDFVRKDMLEPPEQAPSWGRVLAVREQLSELGLIEVLDKLQRRRQKGLAPFADRVVVLVANRICEPRSEHGLAQWLENEFVCNRQGKRFVPEWRDDEERKSSKRPRVRVKDRQLRQWYTTLDELYKHKLEIEKELFVRLRKLFSLNAEMVFYDLTSTYFEGSGPEEAEYGYSRDGKPRNRQVLVGMVMVDGWPIAHHVFRGNLRDSQTVQDILKDVRERFGLERVIFVGDRGMVTSDNITFLKSQGQGYLLGVNRRRSEKVYRYIESARGNWQKCPSGISASEKHEPPNTLVQEVESEETGKRVFVVHSDERHSYESAMREKAMSKVRQELERLQHRVAEGKLRVPEKVGAAAARILSRHHGNRYFAWELKEGRFEYYEHPTNMKRELMLEGKYLIQTEEASITPVEAVRRYKELMEVEQSFRDLKDVIEMRPIYHQKTERVQAHIFVAALALLVRCSIQRKLNRASLDVSSTECLSALRTIQVVDIELKDGRTNRIVTRGTARAQRFLKALGISNRIPPKLKNTKKDDL